MSKKKTCTLGNGREVDVGQNRGLRELCRCERRQWPKCTHSWHFNFAWKEKHYRFSLDRYHGHHIDSKTAAETLAERYPGRDQGPGRSVRPRGRLRRRRRSRRTQHSRSSDWPTAGSRTSAWTRSGPPSTTVRGSVRWWSSRRPWDAAGPEVAAIAVTEDDIEAVFDELRRRGYAASTVNHYVQTVKSVEKWAVRKGQLPLPAVESRHQRPTEEARAAEPETATRCPGRER